MAALTYNRSKIYPDNSVIEWRPNRDHEGFVDGKLRFRVYTDEKMGSTDSSHIQMLTDDGDWEIVSKIFYEVNIWNDLYKTDKEKAKKYNHYHSLHACHQVAEDIICKELKTETIN